jgi:hypothetical protein
MHQVNGKWRVKQTCESHAAAQAAMRLLQGIEHGWHPTGKPAKK